MKDHYEYFMRFDVIDDVRELSEWAINNLGEFNIQWYMQWLSNDPKNYDIRCQIEKDSMHLVEFKLRWL